MHEKRGRGRPRREGADEEILRATRELLAENGYASFNVDLIAARTGIAKTTIYRRWSTKGALVAAAIDSPPVAIDADAIVEEAASLLAFLDHLDADAIEIIRAVLTPRRERLLQATDRDTADMLFGAILARLVLGDAR
ncbi:MAG: TetR/AcrR family transcriptional regulator [Acidobacteriota bacterium]|nr:TetR/AcrR family transcriptional regulator [Acidobacteriota bacterium]